MTFPKHALLFALIALAPTAWADQQTDDMAPKTQPVLIGGDASFDACSSYGAVDGLKDVAGNFLALRTYPGTEGALIAKLENKQDLWMCQEENGWYGVIIPAPDTDCAVSSPIAERGPYTGPCQSGWVYGKFVLPLAG